eukprot:2762547-Pyramimonas_sp.AAC.1
MESQRLQLAKQTVVPIPADEANGEAHVVTPGCAASVGQLGSILRQYGVQDALLEQIVQAGELKHLVAGSGHGAPAAGPGAEGGCLPGEVQGCATPEPRPELPSLQDVPEGELQQLFADVLPFAKEELQRTDATKL